MDLNGLAVTDPSTVDEELRRFAAEVGTHDPVVVAGGRTHWHLGGEPDPRAREVRAPAGVVAHLPAEMIVRVRAGTTVADLDAVLAEAGQMVPLDPADPTRATVGGVLAAGVSGIRRLRYGPVRDTVLEVRYVSAEGRLVKGGAPVVKNVTGYDIPRLMVGSLGTLGCLAEVVLRVTPRPAVSRWLRKDADPVDARARLFRPSAVLWDGATTWVLVEGHDADVEAEANALGSGWTDVVGPPALPGPGRRSLPPGELSSLTGTFLAEIGVGTVHTSEAVARPPVDPSAAHLHRAVKDAFDPTGRLNPGRSV